MKKPTLFLNEVGGIDLLVERDGGNEVRVLTGAPEHSLKFWTRIRQLADEAIGTLRAEHAPKARETGGTA
jgi:hypothetical protein